MPENEIPPAMRVDFYLFHYEQYALVTRAPSIAIAIPIPPGGRVKYATIQPSLPYEEALSRLYTIGKPLTPSLLTNDFEIFIRVFCNDRLQNTHNFFLLI